MNQRFASTDTNRFVFVLLACIAAFGIVLTVPALREEMPAGMYVPVHTVIEFASIVVSFSVFTLGWYGFKQTRNRQDLVIAAIYLTLGALDFVHTLSYKGMPDFLGANTPGKAAAYWLVARMFDALALLGAAFVSAQGKKGAGLSPRSAVILPLVFTGLTVALVTTYHETIAHALFVDPHGELPVKAKAGLTPLKIALEYAIITLYGAGIAAFGRLKHWDRDSSRTLQLALVVGIFAELAFTRYNSPFDGANLLGHVFKTVSYYYVLRALFVSSLRRPYENLRKKEAEATKNAEEARKNLDKFLREEKIANRLQIAFLPKVVPPAPAGYDIGHKYEFSNYDSTVGGDLYDIFALQDGRLALLVGDVSGKGSEAAAKTAMVKFALRAYAEEDPEPPSVVTRLNRALSSQLSEEHLFVTLFYGVLDPRTGRIDYVSAGHEQPLHLSLTGDCEMLDSTGPPLGVLDDALFTSAETTLGPGDIFMVLTDGITEARTCEGFLELEGVAGVVNGCKDTPAQQITERVFESAKAHGKLRDDAVIVLVKRMGRLGDGESGQLRY